MTTARIETERLKLSLIEPSDKRNIHKGLSNLEVTKHYAVHYDSLDAVDEQMSWYDAPEQCWWSIRTKDNVQFCGAVGLNGISKQHRKAEIGMWLLPEYWGLGYMSEAMPAVCSYAFDHLSLHRIEGFVECDNGKCIQALEKLNFKYEGTMKDSEIKDGSFLSIAIYALINESSLIE